MHTAKVSEEVLRAFSLTASPDTVLPYGNGHINDTFLVEEQTPVENRRYILQRLNTEVFRKPVEVMENIAGITGHLSEKIRAAGGDVDRETLHFKPAADGTPYYIDSDNNFWRVFAFVENIICYDQVRCPDDFYQSALTFGHFQYQLSDYPAEKLHDTIPDFHNTPKRYRDFEKAVSEDVMNRVREVPDELAFIHEREAFTHRLTNLLAEGKLPLRVTHNDTKLNNILFDKTTGKGICIIDLDTVMPGLAAYDFGDAIRFGASTAAEDEGDLSKVNFDINLFEHYAKGFLEGCGESLTDAERESLVDGSIMITFENAMRFLADYLEGDHYYKISAPDQNLRRARTHLKLVSDMEKMRPQMEEIIRRL